VRIKLKQNSRKVKQTFFMIIITMMSCQSSSPILTKYYNQNEIKSINELVNFFKDQMCEGHCSQELLHKKLNAILDSLNSGGNFVIEMNKELLNEKLTNSYETLKVSTFSNKCYALDFKNELREPHFCLKSDSTYMRFLEELGKKNKGVEKYRIPFEAFGTITPPAVGHIIKNSNKHKYSEEIITVIAFHFFHLNSEIAAQKILEVKKLELERK